MKTRYHGEENETKFEVKSSQTDAFHKVMCTH